MVYLCFDFGTRSWGVAVGDGFTKTATALAAVSADKGEPDWDKIDQVVSEWSPDEIVIGYPLKASGERFKLTDQVDIAIAKLKDRYPTRMIHQADERLSTVEARENIFSEKGFKGLEKGKIDSESARVILQNWFDSVQGL